jgi:hypothetical protein
MATTYEKIQSTTLGTATATITFSSIPATYTDIRVVLTCTGSGTIYPNARLNNDASALYSVTSLLGNGSTASSWSGTGNDNLAMTFNGISSTPAMYTLDIFSYAGSTFKTILGTESADNNGSGDVQRLVNLYRSTTAINRVDLRGGGNNFAIGTTATLYGILKA